MDTEEEEASKLPNPSIQAEDDPISKTMVMDSHIELQQDAEPQCDPASLTELSQSQPPHQSLVEGKKVVDDLVGGEQKTGAELDDSNLGEGEAVSRDSQPSASPVAGAEDVNLIDGEESRGVGGEDEVADVLEDVESPVQPPLTAGGGDNEDIIGREETLALETEVEREVACAAEEMGKQADVAEETEAADVIKTIDVAEEAVIAEEIGVPDIPKQTENTDDTEVDDVEETTTVVTDEAEVGDVADESELQEDRDVSDVAGETELLEEMGNETNKAGEDAEIPDGVEMEVEGDVAMGDMAEETTEADADMADETEKADVTEEMETGEEVEEVNRTPGGKRKRGKNSKSPGRTPTKKITEEDVCFICFDGGDLVLCDRRGCPKAYHPACVNRDEAFFRAKGRWNCGWHLCSICEKNAYYMCYTCTFSLCKGCIKDAVILCVRGNKGFCETCMKTVMLIERNEQGNREMEQVDFDDKSSWEYLFKDYWLDTKGQLSLSSDELAHAKNPWKGSDIHAGKQHLPVEHNDANNDGGPGSDSSSGNAEATVSKRRKAKKRSKSRAKESSDSPRTVRVTGAEGASSDGSVEWASNELLELVMHMKNGDKSVLSQFDVQVLLLDYIKKYKLRDTRRRTHVICDSRLQNLFGKPRVAHFEMLKLLESHFLTKEDSQVDDLQGSVVDTEANQLEADLNSDALIKSGKDRKRKTRRRGDERGLQSNLDDYAAIDMHNINLIYLRRNLLEELLEDTETFHDKAVGCFVRLKISGSIQKQDMYRLVQVVGTTKVAEPYKVGKKTTDIMLEILNLNKTEVVSMDIFSNQEFTEDECKRLRQSIKCGLINRLTVGDIQEKSMVLQAVRVKDLMEAEIMRLSHLRDRASDLGRRKELRECVEKLQLLKTPEERQRRLEENPEIHSDPNMDPSYESEEDEDETDDKRQENYTRPRGSGFSRRGREPISPQKGGSAVNDSLSGTRNYSGGNKELSRNMSNKGFSNKGDDFFGAGEIVNEHLWNQGRDKEPQQLNSWEKPRTAPNLETGARNPHSVVLSESISRPISEISPSSASTRVTNSIAKTNESEKIWHYKDPSGKVQGPFSVVQLRKWSNTGYFPSDLRIWRATEKQDDSILLTDALMGKLSKDPPLVDTSFSKSQVVSYSAKPHLAPSQQGIDGQVRGNSNFDQNRTAWSPHATLGSSGQSVGESWKFQPEASSSTGGAAPSLLEVPKHFRDGWGSETNLPSPTPTQGTAGETKGKTFEKDWSPTPVKSSSSLMNANLLPGVAGGQQLPNVLVPESGQMTHGAISAAKPETGESHRVQVHAHQQPAAGSVGSGVDMKNIGASLQSLVQHVNTHIPPFETPGWGSSLGAPSQKLEPNHSVTMPAQSPTFGQLHVPSFGMGNSSGVFPAGQSGMLQSDSWRPQVVGQSNIQPPAQPNLPWGIGVPGNQIAVTRQGPVPVPKPMPGNPSMGWGGQVPASANMNQGAPGIPNSGYGASGQGQATGPGWAPPVQGSAPVNANLGWVAPGNANSSWTAPAGNPGMWGSDQNNGGDRFSSQRDRGSQNNGGGGGRGWSNRQSSFSSRGGSGDPSRPPFNKGQRLCKFFESGHCKKGSQCDYLHS